MKKKKPSKTPKNKAPSPSSSSEAPGNPAAATHPVKSTERVALKDIITTAGTQARVTMDQEVITEYGEVVKSAIKDGREIPFPPGEAFRTPEGKIILVDGFQRLYGHKGGGAKEMLLNLRDGDERDALLFSCGVNATHGVRRTAKDKNRAVKLLLDDSEWSKWANTEIARACNVSEGTVRGLRTVKNSPDVRTAKRAGKTIEIKTKKIGKKKDQAETQPKDAKTEGKKSDASAPPKADDDETNKAIRKIGGVIGGKEGESIRKALEEGTLELSPAEIRAWAQSSDGRIIKIAPLVVGNRWKPSKAYAFIDAECTGATKAEHFVNLTVAGLGYSEEKVDEHHKIICVDIRAFKIERNLADKSVSITKK